MLIENIMYFALGLLAAGLLALIIMPAVWKRAVRLTKRRIEAATPITMAEFRADKDQLRAEFALTTRKLEMTIETLRKRLADQLNDADGRRTDMGVLKNEREGYLAELSERGTREAQMSARLAELERDTTDLGQRLRMRERELLERGKEVQSLREATRGDLPKASELETKSLSGDYDADIDKLSTALIIERKRAAVLEQQATSLLLQLDASPNNAATAAAITRMRDALDRRNDRKAENEGILVAAEERFSNAESALNAILAEATSDAEPANGRGNAPLLAEKLTTEANTEALRLKVKGLESAILADWGNDEADPEDMRAQLADIATSVSKLVYAAQSEKAATEETDEESLFDKVQRFASEIETIGTAPLPPKPSKSASPKKGRVSDRMTALREIQGR